MLDGPKVVVDEDDVECRHQQDRLDGQLTTQPDQGRRVRNVLLFVQEGVNAGVRQPFLDGGACDVGDARPATGHSVDGGQLFGLAVGLFAAQTQLHYLLAGPEVRLDWTCRTFGLPVAEQPRDGLCGEACRNLVNVEDSSLCISEGGPMETHNADGLAQHTDVAAKGDLVMRILRRLDSQDVHQFLSTNLDGPQPVVPAVLWKRRYRMEQAEL